MPEDQYELDEIDRGIIHLLQKDARNTSTREIGEAVNVSTGTVRNRIENLEENGVLQGYIPDINYEKAGYPLQIIFTCTSSDASEKLTQKILDQHGVVSVQKLLAGEKNYHVKAVATSTDDASEIAGLIQECGLRIIRSDVVDDQFLQPFNHFGTVIEEED